MAVFIKPLYQKRVSHLCSGCSRCVLAAGVCRVCPGSVCSAAGDVEDSEERRLMECNTPSAAQTHGTRAPAAGTQRTLSPARTHTLSSSAAELRETEGGQTHNTVTNRTENTASAQHTHTHLEVLYGFQQQVSYMLEIFLILHTATAFPKIHNKHIVLWLTGERKSGSE